MKHPLSHTFILSMSLWGIFSHPSFADHFDFKTYFPAPYGTYDTIRLKPQSALPTTGCTAGTLYSNSSDQNNIYFCDNISGSPQYQRLLGIWVAEDTNNALPFAKQIYVRDSASRDNIKVGIGTDTPAFKLTLVNDGGILAQYKDDLSNGTPLNASGPGARLVLFGRLSSFVAGYAAGNEWDASNIPGETILMGYGNSYISGPSGYALSIHGGKNNTASGNYVTIAGGTNNVAYNTNTSILGGSNNTAGSGTDLTYRNVVSGFTNTTHGDSNTIMGGANNSMLAAHATILGGSNNNINGANTSDNYAAFIGGGASNIINSNSAYGIILGGLSNNLNANNKQASVISGGAWNTINANSASILGGASNISYQYAAVIGGHENNINTGGIYSVIFGGFHNTITNSSCVISGGQINNISGIGSTVTGGRNNIASGGYSTITGGDSNTTAAQYSLVAGRGMSLSSFAQGTFLWGYTAATPVAIDKAHAFIISGGMLTTSPAVTWTPKVGIRDTNPWALLEVNSNGSSDNYLTLTSTSSSTAGNKMIITSNGYIGMGTTTPSYPLSFSGGAYVDTNGRFMNASSRVFKEKIQDVSLSQAENAFHKLNPVKFNYKNEPDQTYLGFIAEDVPDLVVEKSRQGLSPMDIAAVLTKVIQEQDRIINTQKEETKNLLKEVQDLKNIYLKRSQPNSHTTEGFSNKVGLTSYE